MVLAPNTLPSSTWCVLTLAVGAGLLSALYLAWRLRLRHRSTPLDIRVVTNITECDIVVEELRSRCQIHHAVGFDCEWVTSNSSRQPVALLQLASYDGLCGLFRLNLLKSFPDSLKDILEDEQIYKVGVVPMDDAKYLTQDYSILPRGTLDIRHIVKLCELKTGGLASLALAHLGLVMDKHWRIRCSDWEAGTLTERQCHYAATDAHAALRIFVNLIGQYYGKNRFPFIPSSADDAEVWHNVDRICQKFADLSFKAKKNVTVNTNESKRRKNNAKDSAERKKYSATPRLKPLYQNCFLQAPDGELLCTIDDKKAQWYVDKELADKVTEEPLTVRLRFEPAGRAVGEVGRYYKLEKANRCVVCGQADSYIRKNVVPREYRKYFPDIMKEHSSHDVVLLCLACHQRSNASDLHVRRRLAAQADAPLDHIDPLRKTETAHEKAVRMAARALLYDLKHRNLPAARRQELEGTVRKHLAGCDQLTEELLTEASDCQLVHENENVESHGSKVVGHYIQKEGGLLKLEKLWREHFVSTMRPKYLPELWCLNHNEERLMIRVREGRIDHADIRIVGLQPS